MRPPDTAMDDDCRGEPFGNLRIDPFEMLFTHVAAPRRIDAYTFASTAAVAENKPLAKCRRGRITLCRAPPENCSSLGINSLYRPRRADQHLHLLHDVHNHRR